MQVDQLMEQSQVFASAWSLVGTFFDRGEQKTIAEDEKVKLRKMLERALPATGDSEMVLVTKKDANTFCEIVSALGLENDEESGVLDTILILRNKQEEMLEFVKKISAWHESRLLYTRDIQDAVKDGTKVECGDKTIELTGREALIFNLGMEAGLASFEKLPFTLTESSDDLDDEEEDAE